jgi:hypothetical protein
MTKKQKQNTIADIRQGLETIGFKIDSFGNYKTTSTPTYRVKIMANNIRFERKGFESWVCISSISISSILDIPAYLAKVKLRAAL